MTSNEIIALRCPSCGEGITQPSREMPFGAEFRCDGCDITSVLIVNRDLVPLSTLQKLGEKVCAECGRIVQRDARFCQEGHSLVRKCVNQECLKEFSVDHQRCDFCGWPQHVAPGTAQSADLKVDRAIQELSDPSVYTLLTALKTIKSAGSVGVKAVPSILILLSDRGRAELKCGYEYDDYSTIEEVCWVVLAHMGPAASDAVPFLLRRINEIWTNYQHRDLYLQVLAVVSPLDVLPLCKKGLQECDVGNGPWSLTNAAKIIGEAAIPTLEEFCTFFYSVRSTACKEAINEIRKNGRHAFSRGV